MYAEAEKDIAAKFPGSRITLRTWSTNGAQEHILDKLGYSLVRRLKDDRGEGIDTVYFVKKEEKRQITWCLQIAVESVIIGSIRQQKEGYSYALYNYFSWKESII